VLHILAKRLASFFAGIPRNYGPDPSTTSISLKTRSHLPMPRMTDNVRRSRPLLAAKHVIVDSCQSGYGEVGVTQSSNPAAAIKIDRHPSILSGVGDRYISPPAAWSGFFAGGLAGPNLSPTSEPGKWPDSSSVPLLLLGKTCHSQVMGVRGCNQKEDFGSA